MAGKKLGGDYFRFNYKNFIYMSFTFTVALVRQLAAVREDLALKEN
jgi:hypothetical protein